MNVILKKNIKKNINYKKKKHTTGTKNFLN